MTGIERLRQMAHDFRSVRVTGRTSFNVNMWRNQFIEDAIDSIADHIELEQDKIARTDWEAVRDVADDMNRKVFGIAETDALVERWASTLYDALDGRERRVHDPTADVSMSAYDLLPEDEREAIAWVRKHGGLDRVRERFARSVPVEHALRAKAKRERLKSHAAALERVCAERRDKIRELNKIIAAMRPRLMPEGMEWPRFEDGEPVKFGDEWKLKTGGDGSVGSVTLRDDSFALNASWFDKGERVERPDSWERLEEDVANASCPDVYCANHNIDASDTSYEWAMARDIVRRARALAERVQ